jgi:ADP-heptose:LPS heptosyltransferase
MKWLDIVVEWEGDIARTYKRSHAAESLAQLVDTVAAACEDDRTMVSRPVSTADARRVIGGIPAVAEIAQRLFSRTLVCVHTGAGALNKQWPAAYFSGLIDLLIGQEGVNVVVIGGPDEQEFAQRVIDGAQRSSSVFSLVGKTSLRDLPNVLRACDLYVGNDSGPKHMAASLGVPTIGIHSGSVDAGEWGPLGPHTVTIRRDMTCSPCYLARASDCHRSLACLTGIKVGDVYRACQRMLTLSRSAGAAEGDVDAVAELFAAAED